MAEILSPQERQEIIDEFVKKRHVLVGALALLYIASPVDFIPEVIAGPLGLIDDGAALLVLISSYNKYKTEKQSAVLEMQRIANERQQMQSQQIAQALWHIYNSQNQVNYQASPTVYPVNVPQTKSIVYRRK